MYLLLGKDQRQQAVDHRLVQQINDQGVPPASWEILLGALTILFFLYQKSRNETKKDLTRKFMAAAMLCAVVVNGVQIFKFAFPQDQYPAICDHLTQLIAFWK